LRSGSVHSFAFVTRTPTHDAADVAILEHDDDLARAVPEAERDVASGELLLRAMAVEPGPVAVGDLGLSDATMALVIVDGTLTNDIAVDGHAVTEMLGPGDLIPPWEPELTELDVRRRIVAKTPALLAVVDAGFARAAARWPGLLVTLCRRMAEQEHRFATQGAICQMARVEDRIVAMLRHLAARHGKVVPGGRTLDVRLTHEALGRLVGARRPTVTLAIKQLEADGRLTRRPDGTWLLPCPGSD
jgi:CRP/FNR family transcriptional regulator, cyclic AMP receptor protein